MFVIYFCSGDESVEERGELMAAQVDIPSEDTPREEKDAMDSANTAVKPNNEYGLSLKLSIMGIYFIANKCPLVMFVDE